jgi:hypothetical protein
MREPQLAGDLTRGIGLIEHLSEMRPDARPSFGEQRCGGLRG